MRADKKFLKDDRDYDEEDEIHINYQDNSDSEEEIMSDSDSDSDSSFHASDDSSNDDSSDSGQNEQSSASKTNTGENGEEEEEEDEVIKAILKSKELIRDHPHTISVDDALADICFHPVNDIIALASITGDVFMYKYSNDENNLLSTLELHDRACRDIEFSKDGKILYSTSKDSEIMLSDVETEKLIGLYESAHDQPIYSMLIMDENTFATGDDDGTVKLWDRRRKNHDPIFSLKEMEDYVSSMVTNEDQRYLVCASGDGTLTTLNIRGKKLHVQTEDYPQELTCLGLFKRETKILAAGSKGNLFIFNWGEFGLHSDEIPSLTKKSINCIIPITETIVVTGGEDKILRATNLFPNRQLGVVGQHDLSIEYLDICNDGTIIASYSYDNSVKFWNISYFETLNVSEPVKGGKQKQVKHNLPSSKFDNASDFFADL